ncbi:metallophosphoesterase (plasmid) [Roseomonas gilardii subsp. gilardii]|uniref:metallophosphoesterase family protein n=1 Tax=Roseomonas gilardii TaxID=257708 RepID=UPI001FFAC6B5|nr:metallophosphoesterase [Roseomonas gilardii]UPG74651.1 metallophosphoesterase [Roseomonas gilardii subsp. gilardii]
MSFSLAHLSDLHLPVPPGAIRPLSQLAGKRLLAYFAWRRKRRRAVSAAALLADLAAAGAEHLAITGDLTNLALPGEFAAARDWLAALGPPERVTVVPGNHDATVPLPWASGIGHWAPWMAGEATGAPFPFLRRRGAVALIGLSSAAPTPPGSAAGRLGAAQLSALPGLLDAAGREGLFRIVMVHHPPLPGPGGRRKALSDRAALCAVLARHGAELVLHGHHHRPLRGEVPGPRGPIPVLGPPQALAAGHGGPAGWQMLRITREAEGWRVAVELRMQDLSDGVFRAAPATILRISSGGGWSSAIPLAAR